MRKIATLIFVGLLTSFVLSQQVFAEEEFKRSYPVVASPLHNSDANVIDSWSLYTFLEDSYHDWKISSSKNYSSPLAKVGVKALSFLWHFNLMVNFTMWPHEGGHWIRTREFGHSFSLTQFEFGNFPRYVGGSTNYGPGATNIEIMMGELGGIEINHMQGLYGQKLAYQRDHAYADDLFFLAFNKMHWLLYTFVYTGYNPGNPSSWVDTDGDPQAYADALFKQHFGRNPVTTTTGVIASSRVPPNQLILDPQATSFYREISFATFWALLDPLVVQGFYQFPRYIVTDKRDVDLWWFKTGPVKWMYGTQYNLSPMGYELYLNFYLHFLDRFAISYFRFGRPRSNVGGGIEMPVIHQWGRFKIGGGFDIYDQQDFGTGVNFFVLPKFQITKGISLLGKMGLKNNGYVMGQPLEGTVYGYGGLEFSFY